MGVSNIVMKQVLLLRTPTGFKVVTYDDDGEELKTKKFRKEELESAKDYQRKIKINLRKLP